MQFFGRSVHTFSSTHERSHLFCAYGMSPLPQGQPCYLLVWEGNIGAFYEIDQQLEITRLAHVLEDPGSKFQYLFALANPGFTDNEISFRFENAGKLMALAGHAEDKPTTDDEKRIIDFILAQRSMILSTPKSKVRWSPFYNIGVEAQELMPSGQIVRRDIHQILRGCPQEAN